MNLIQFQSIYYTIFSVVILSKKLTHKFSTSFGGLQRYAGSSFTVRICFMNLIQFQIYLLDYVQYSNFIEENLPLKQQEKKSFAYIFTCNRFGSQSMFTIQVSRVVVFFNHFAAPFPINQRFALH